MVTSWSKFIETYLALQWFLVSSSNSNTSFRLSLSVTTFLSARKYSDVSILIPVTLSLCHSFPFLMFLWETLLRSGLSLGELSDCIFISMYPSVNPLLCLISGHYLRELATGARWRSVGWTRTSWRGTQYHRCLFTSSSPTSPNCHITYPYAIHLLHHHCHL